MNTTYDELYTRFLNIAKSEDYNLPQTNEQKYELIHMAIDDIDIRLDLEISYDDTLELVSEKLSKNKILIITNYMKLHQMRNDYHYLSTFLTPFEQDIGTKNVTAQLNAQKSSIEKQEEQVEKYIMYEVDDFM